MRGSERAPPELRRRSDPVRHSVAGSTTVRQCLLVKFLHDTVLWAAGSVMAALSGNGQAGGGLAHELPPARQRSLRRVTGAGRVRLTFGVPGARITLRYVTLAKAIWYGLTMTLPESSSRSDGGSNGR